MYMFSSDVFDKKGGLWMSYNGTSSPCQSKLEVVVVGSTWCVCKYIEKWTA